ncbi:MAG: GNAT family N-acetyltransferase [Muribaculum sp.]|nr:GNAT family N-acetyltransferase [Muribaculum sp.]
MITITKYTPEWKSRWDSFISTSKNGTFLMLRDYMEYHSDRFTDYSLILSNENRICGLFVASIHDGGKLVKCHGGLTYGGLITSKKATFEDVKNMFIALNDYMHKNGVGEVIYKAVPYIYHSEPADEDLYVLHSLCKAKLIRRDISSTVDMTQPVRIRRIRDCGKRKALKHGLSTVLSNDVDSFWEILNSTLHARHGVAPVHSKEELKLLASRFPDNIRLITAITPDGSMIGGTILYITDTCIHSQYIATNDIGRETGALDLIFIDILQSKFDCTEGRRYFDFGRSTEGDGTYVNTALLYQKEGFGARAICYDTYSYRPE